MTSSLLRHGPLDVHAHVVPEPLLERLGAGAPAGFSVETTDDGRPRVIRGGEPLAPPLMRGMHALEPRLRVMDEQGVAVQLLSPWVSLTGYHLSEADGVWLSEAQNDTIGALVRAMPDRFLGLGSVPLQAPTIAADLLRKLMLEQRLLGAQIAATAGPDRDLDDPALEPFWSAAEELRAFILIHPYQGVSSKRFARYYLGNLVQNPLDTTIAGACLIFGGVLERHPELRICLAHGGGFLPYNLGRLIRGRLVRSEAAVSMAGSVEDSFGRLHFDSVTHSPSALRFLVGEAGPERVLLGSDFPFDMGDPDPVGTVRAAGLASEPVELVLRGNAERLLRD
jgi:aminocarboxymuconate-semialdehyde decarboxylase